MDNLLCKNNRKTRLIDFLNNHPTYLNKKTGFSNYYYYTLEEFISMPFNNKPLLRLQEECKMFLEQEEIINIAKDQVEQRVSPFLSTRIGAIPCLLDLVYLIINRHEYQAPLTNIINALSTPTSLLVDLLDVKEEQLNRLPGIGRSKVDKFIKLQKYVRNEENWDRILDIYDSCFKEHRFPENLSIEQQQLSLTDRIDIAVVQYIDYLKKISQYYGSVKSDYERTKLIFIERLSRGEIANRLGLTEERARQIKVKYLQDLYEGSLKFCTNLKLSDDIKEEINSFVELMPLYCSKEQFDNILGCENFEESSLGLMLPIKLAPEKYTSLNNYPYKNAFDQQYYIPIYDDIKNLQKYLVTMYKALESDCTFAEIRPVSLDEMMDIMLKIEPNYEFEREIVQELLNQHNWYEKVGSEEDLKYQIAYKYLATTPKRVGRLVYELKRVNTKDINNLHRERMSDPNAFINNPRSNMMPWVVFGGENNILEYREDGAGRQNLQRAVHEYVSRKIFFKFDEIRNYLEEQGYKNLKNNTIRAYIFNLCTCDNRDTDLFCLNDAIEKYPQYSWRNKAQNGIVNWVINNVRQCLLSASNNTLKLKDLTEKVKENAKQSSEEYILIDIWRYISRYIGDDDVFGINKVDNEIFICLTQVGLEKNDEEWSVMGRRNRKPQYYDLVVAKIVSLLKDAENCQLPLSKLRDDCREYMESECINNFYKIVDNELPDQIVKIEIDGVKYLKFEQDKVQYEPSVTIAKTLQTKNIVEPVYETKSVEKKERSLGHVINMDWRILRENLQDELSFYSRFWDLDLTMNDAIDIFLQFLQGLSNSRLSIQIPRKLLVLWNYQSDVYDRKELLNELVLCYEELLRFIHQSNTGCWIMGNGLYETYKEIPEIKWWTENVNSDSNNYRKYFDFLHQLRNKIAHGGEKRFNTIQLMQRITEYTALYVYTVARFVYRK